MLSRSKCCKGLISLCVKNESGNQVETIFTKEKEKFFFDFGLHKLKHFFSLSL